MAPTDRQKNAARCDATTTLDGLLAHVADLERELSDVRRELAALRPTRPALAFPLTALELTVHDYLFAVEIHHVVEVTPMVLVAGKGSADGQ